MSGKRVFSVLLLLIPLTSGAGLMKYSTCATIQYQLSLIGDSIRHEARNFQSAPFYAGETVDVRLRLLLDAYHNRIAQYQQYGNQMSTFVQGKLKQFNLPVDGLENNISLIEKIFSTVEDRNAFQRLQVTEQKQSNQNVTAEIAENQKLLETLKLQSQQLQLQLAGLNETLALVETENKKLQATINDNAPHVRG
ncbi:uncharacterized protein LOC126560983 [Anopheles maculipalpis]|uniref:uncharacterized protein LOC126560983 n=1 Tax=Anopheles maculipalpis TaxID=1496333 RepID=UPI00215929D3|nr:uncharacterized protein LOC126560983 [Anopheles maculipalpis]